MRHETTKNRQEVMKRIRTGKLAMKPRWRFVIVGLLSAVGALIVSAAAIFMVNIIFYDQRQGTIFSWLALAAAMVGLALLFALIRRFDFSYKTRRAVLFVLILALATGIGFALSRTNVNHYTEDFGPLKPAYTYKAQHGKDGDSNHGPNSGPMRGTQNGQQDQMMQGAGQNNQKNKP